VPVKVLVLRAEPSATRTRRALAALGHEAVLAPLAAIVALAGGGIPPGEDGRPYGAVIAASASALAMVAEESRPLLAGLPAMVVGARTAEMARELGLHLPWPIYRTALDLAAALATNRPQGPVLYLVGRERRPEIEAALRRHAPEFRLVELYAARTAERLPESAGSGLRLGEIGAVLHYSARSADAYVKLATREGLLVEALAPLQLCLSAAVGRPLAAAGAPRLRISPAPDEAHLLALLQGPAAS
jgi:uroporphyrinogen-III synthase